MRLIGFPDDAKDRESPRYDVPPADRLPALARIRDVFVLPGRDALYTADGIRIETSKRVTVPADMASAATNAARIEHAYRDYFPATVDIPADYEVLDEEVLFVGATWPHYGHFLTDGMSRLWALESAPPDIPLLFLNRAGRDFGGMAYSRFVVDALDIRGRLFDCERPTLIRSVLVPEPAIQHAYRIYHAHRRPHAAVARRVLVPGASAFAGKKIYLSRSRLQPGLRQAAAEAQLEDRIAALGIAIVYPETISMLDQIDLFNNAAFVVGTVGSAFHTELFSLRGAATRLMQFCWGKLNNRYPMIDDIVGSSVDYVNSTTVTATNEKSRIATMDLDVEMSMAAIESALAKL